MDRNHTLSSVLPATARQWRSKSPATRPSRLGVYLPRHRPHRSELDISHAPPPPNQCTVNAMLMHCQYPVSAPGGTLGEIPSRAMSPPTLPRVGQLALRIPDFTAQPHSPFVTAGRTLTSNATRTTAHRRTTAATPKQHPVNATSMHRQCTVSACQWPVPSTLAIDSRGSADPSLPNWE